MSDVSIAKDKIAMGVTFVCFLFLTVGTIHMEYENLWYVLSHHMKQSMWLMKAVFIGLQYQLNINSVWSKGVRK